jgi:hypothetical protein
MGRRLLASALALTCAPAAGASARGESEGARGEARGLAFWTAFAAGCEVPAGETAASLVGEAVGFLGSPDPRWRDDVGYGVVAACVYGKERLSVEERRALVASLSRELRAGLGETDTPSVLRRSFSALDLSILAAAELRAPALDEAGYRTLLDDALAYLRDERDLRGFAPGVGWIHATAHTADLLKFLSRDRRFSPADQARVLDAVWAKATAPGTPVFTHAENERMAAAVASVVRRADFDASAFSLWLERFPALEKDLWAKSPPEAAALDAAQNARDLLASLYVLLSLPPPGGGPAPEAAASARAAVLAALGRIRRS